MAKKKTVREWFKGFQEPYKTKALKNLEGNWGDHLAESASGALIAGFRWHYAPENYKYWSDFHAVLSNIES